MTNSTSDPPPARVKSSIGLRAARRFEPRMLFAVLAALAAVWAFLGLTGEVREQETTQFDQTVLLAFRAKGNTAQLLGPRWLQESGRDVTALGGFTVLTVLSALAVAILLMQGRRMQAAIFGGAVVSAQVAAETVKHIVNRPRPELVVQHDFVYSSSFPSGHALMTPVVYLTLAAIVAAGSSRRSIKLTLLIGGALLVVAVGVSRVYLGVHWPTDVLAGWTMGSLIAWVAAVALHLTAPQYPAKATVEPDAAGAK